jgi:hypothetical protein
MSAFWRKSSNKSRNVGKIKCVCPGFGAKQNIANAHKISEERIKPRQFISLRKSANGLESYLYIFQEKPTPHFKEYPSVPGNFLYDTAESALLRPLVKEVRDAIKPAKGVTVRSIDEIISAMGDLMFLDKLYGVQLPKVLLK